MMGINEIIWLVNPSPEIEDYYQRVMGVNPESEDGWLALLKKAGFTNIKSSVHAIKYRQKVRGDLELQSRDFFRIWGPFPPFVP